MLRTVSIRLFPSTVTNATLQKSDEGRSTKNLLPAKGGANTNKGPLSGWEIWQCLTARWPKTQGRVLDTMSSSVGNSGPITSNLPENAL